MDDRPKYERNKDRWMNFFMPVDVGLLIKAEATVRKCSYNAVISEHAAAYREMMQDRVNLLAERKKQACFVERDAPWTMLGFPDLIELGVDEDGCPEVMGLEEYIDKVQEEYDRLISNHRLARTIAKDRAIKKAIAEKAQQSARPQAVAVAGTAGQGGHG